MKSHSLSINKAREHIMRLQQSTKKARAKAGELMETAIETAETVGSAFGFGMWEGRVQDPKHFEIGGMPIPLIVGVGAHAFALFGVGRGMDPHFRSIGNGALCAHLNGVGRRMGQQWAVKAGGSAQRVCCGTCNRIWRFAGSRYAPRYGDY